MNTYTFRYKNLTRELPVYEVGGGVKIAYLDTLSDFELVSALAEDMAKICAEKHMRGSAPIVLFTAENKGVPFAYSVAHALAARGNAVEVVIARKKQKKFFGECICAEKFSITGGAEGDKLFVTEYDRAKLKNARVILLDDFYSTGASMRALESLALDCGAEIADKVVAVLEESGGEKPDVKYVTAMPLL